VLEEQVMRKETYYFSIIEPIMLLHHMVGMVITKYNLPISGIMRDGHFYPDINPYPFMNAVIASYFEKKSTALEGITENAYPKDCYESLAGWGVPQIYWASICREVFNSLVHSLQSVIPDYKQDDSTFVQFGIADTDDLMLWITHYA
jgi:hypothetical protein